ncbi:MAG: HepT-like ribonuclease domain-containing protein [Kineosporiaceae bacterium]
MQRELLLLEELAEAAEQAHRLVAGVSLQALVEDRVLRDALLWNFTVLGEAASQLPSEFTSRHPQVPWRQPVRLRNRIVHGYWSIDLEILHTTAQSQLPEFAAEVRRILATLTDTITD